MIDIKFLRENPNIIKENLKARNQENKIKLVDDILSNDKKNRENKIKEDNLRYKRNQISLEINKLAKEKKDIKKLLTQAKKIPLEISKLESQRQKIEKEIKNLLLQIPNVLDTSVPIGTDSKQNIQISEHGKIQKKDFEIKNHADILEELDLIDFKNAARVSGKGFYFLKGNIALLDIALQRFAVDFLIKKGYTLIQPPYMLKKEFYSGVTDHKNFEVMMYKIEDEDLHLIATSEHPIAAMFSNNILEEKDLPVKIVGVSPCFRKEIGSHGLDERGLFRVHQFNKVEQFIFCRPEDSQKYHKELLANVEEIYKKLEIPYRVVVLCSGDTAITAAKTYDLEVYMPRESQYKEAASCSNCTSYQAVGSNIKYRKGQEKFYVHTLNSTAIAATRTIRAIVENYQQKDKSIKIPKVLHDYMNGLKEIKKS